MSAPCWYIAESYIDHSAATQAIPTVELSRTSDTPFFKEDYPISRGLSGHKTRLAEYSRSVYLHTRVLWLEARRQAEQNKKVGHFSPPIRFDPFRPPSVCPTVPSLPVSAHYQATLT
jgi:hypothetical protein